MQIRETKDVLVVDDDKSIRSVIAAALKRLGLRCDTASDGAEGLALIGSTVYSVVVVDMMMPNVDGLAFIRALRKEQPRSTEGPVVLLMTACPLEDVPALGSEVQGLVAKPFDVLDFAEMIRDCVELWRFDSKNASRSSEASADATELPSRPFDTN